jgi:hypothetical protein
VRCDCQPHGGLPCVEITKELYRRHGISLSAHIPHTVVRSYCELRPQLLVTRRCNAESGKDRAARRDSHPARSEPRTASREPRAANREPRAASSERRSS